MSSKSKSKQANKLLLLQQQLQSMDQMAELLDWSYSRCLGVDIGGGGAIKPEQLEKFESLTARFARFNDILLQKIFRLIDSIDLDDTGTVRDRINRAEKKGLIPDAWRFIEIRELRNSIAHEYQPEALKLIFPEVLKATPELLSIAVNVRDYCVRFE